jgi:hypothetical protein
MESEKKKKSAHNASSFFFSVVHGRGQGASALFLISVLSHDASPQSLSPPGARVFERRVDRAKIGNWALTRNKRTPFLRPFHAFVFRVLSASRSSLGLFLPAAFGSEISEGQRLRASRREQQSLSDQSKTIILSFCARGASLVRPSESAPTGCCLDFPALQGTSSGRKGSLHRNSRILGFFSILSIP